MAYIVQRRPFCAIMCLPSQFYFIIFIMHLFSTPFHTRRQDSTRDQPRRALAQYDTQESAEMLRLYLQLLAMQPSFGADASPARPPAASQVAIARLPTARIYPCDKTKFQDDTSTCGVCCERLIDGVMLSRMPCGHVYHINCIVPWLKRSCTCPECRYEIESNDEDYEVGRIQRMKERDVRRCPIDASPAVIWSLTPSYDCSEKTADDDSASSRSYHARCA
jgi:hypothetical protein